MAVVWPSKNNFANGDVLTAANMNNIADTLNVFNPSSATNGQIWIANGSGSGSYQTISVAAMTSLATGTCSTTQVSITGISNAYKDLILEVWGINAASGPIISFTVNNSSGNYIGAIMRTLNGTYGTAGSTYTKVNATDGASQHTSVNNYTRVYIPNYNNITNRCTIIVNSSTEYGFVTYGTYYGIYNKRDITAPVSSIQIDSTVSMTAGTYRLWGLN